MKRFVRLITWIAVTAIVLPECSSGADRSAAPVNLGDQKWVTWDDSLFESNSGITFEMQLPNRTGDKCLVADKPWESWQLGGFHSLLYDEGKFRLWYAVSHGVRHGEEYAVAYAESTDGIHWTKPELGLVEYAGSRQNNLVVPYNSVIGQVFIDPNAAPAEKYRMLAAIYQLKETDPHRYLTVLTSPDGLRWSVPERTVLPESGGVALDTQSQAFWDRDRQSYVLFTRMGPWRQIGRCESSDIFRFPTPEYVIRPDVPQAEDFYQPGVTKYDEAVNGYFSIIPVFFHPGDAKGEPLPGKAAVRVNYGGNPLTVAAPDTLDLHLFTSSDSIHWQRHGRHRPFIGLGVDGGFDSRSLYGGVGYAIVGDEIWLYYSGYNCTHMGSLDGAAPFERYLGTISRDTLRRDGFVGAAAGEGGAQIVTRPITFTGNQLELNIDCSAGGDAAVELLTATGEPVSDHALQDCDTIFHNNVRKVVTWQGKSDLSALAGTTVKLRLVLRDCRLYALQFGTSP